MKITERDGTIWITNKVNFVDNCIMFSTPDGSDEELFMADVKSIEIS